MTVYASGSRVDTRNLGVVAPKDVQAGREYIWEYWTPAITFAVISPETLTGFVQGLLNLDNLVKKNFPDVGRPPVEITGVTIDDTTGNIWVRGRIIAVPVQNVEQAGVNPLTVFALIGLVFGIIGVAVSLRYVYDVTAGPQHGAGVLDPCTNPGIANYIACIAQESKWFFFGALFGVVALVVFLLIRFGPKGASTS